MPQVEITIGGRNFEVACQEGEEQFLMTAAAMLDVEASSLSTQVGRMPESRMLMMAGLLLADRTANPCANFSKLLIWIRAPSQVNVIPMP